MRKTNVSKAPIFYPRTMLDYSMAAIAKVRPRSEIIMRLIQPLASAGVRILTRWRVNPLWIVFSHAVLGFIAAFLLFIQETDLWWVAALLLQLKTLLDNMDGGLARATGQITLMGRYFDTGMDFLVNIALFAALSLYGPIWLCWLAFLLLTLILSLDFNAERLYKEARLPPVQESLPPVGAPQVIYQVFRGMYTLLFKPQDNLIEKLDKTLFQVIAGHHHLEASPAQQKIWSDLFSTASLVNLGLSTQMFMLGLCLVMGRPYWYIYCVLLQASYVVMIQIIRTIRLKRYFRHTGLKVHH